jgi:hypothetical protein
VTKGTDISAFSGNATPKKFQSLLEGGRKMLKVVSVIRWTARGTAALIAIGFVVFALGEPMDLSMSLGFREWTGMVLLLGAVAAMLLAWKWEFPGALISLLALVAFAVVVHMRRYDVLAIAAIPNVLFLVDWMLRRLHHEPLAKAR